MYKLSMSHFSGFNTPKIIKIVIKIGCIWHLALFGKTTHLVQSLINLVTMIRSCSSTEVSNKPKAYFPLCTSSTSGSLLFIFCKENTITCSSITKMLYLYRKSANQRRRQLMQIIVDDFQLELVFFNRGCRSKCYVR